MDAFCKLILTSKPSLYLDNGRAVLGKADPIESARFTVIMGILKTVVLVRYVDALTTVDFGCTWSAIGSPRDVRTVVFLRRTPPLEICKVSLLWTGAYCMRHVTTHGLTTHYALILSTRPVAFDAVAQLVDERGSRHRDIYVTSVGLNVRLDENGQTTGVAVNLSTGTFLSPQTVTPKVMVCVLAVTIPRPSNAPMPLTTRLAFSTMNTPSDGMAWIATSPTWRVTTLLIITRLGVIITRDGVT